MLLLVLSPLFKLCALIWFCIFLWHVYKNIEALTGDTQVPTAQKTILWFSGTVAVSSYGAYLLFSTLFKARSTVIRSKFKVMKKF
jgi:hypothetical protein